MKMQPKSAPKAHAIRIAFYLFLLLAGTAMAFLGPQTASTASHPAVVGLSFEERVSYQRAIEDVYWRHRIWPRENPYPKPWLDAVMSQATIEQKVQDYLRNSELLEQEWQKPITSEQLQAEMDRIAQHTKQPEVLGELFEALGNDPFVIAECLARPVLAQRMISRSQATQIKTDVPTTTIRAATTSSFTLPKISDGGDGCTDDTWTPTNITNAPDARYSHKGVWTGTEMIIWGGRDASNNFVTGGRYNPSTDSWTSTSVLNAPEGNVGFTAVWTGTEMIVWGGVYCCPLVYFNTGGRYNPSTDTWVATTTIRAPDGRSSHTAVWTGTEMILWGGSNASGRLDTGGRYNPNTDTWTATAMTNVPSGRYAHSAVWTGDEMIVWGGTDGTGITYFDTGGRYNPVTNTWMATSTTTAPDGRLDHSAVWTGSEMIVWGGASSKGFFNTGGKYNPFTDSWTTTSNIGAPSPRAAQTAVWTGSEMIVWAGDIYDGSYHYFNTGGRYNAFIDSWTATSTVNVPSERYAHVAVWTGSEMIVWGGLSNSGFLNTGGRYCSEVGSTPTPTPIPILLYAQKDDSQAIHTVHLSWSGATPNRVDVYRNNTVVATTANDGFYKDVTGETRRADYTYKICEAGNQTNCSNQITVSFSKNVSATWSSNPVSGDWNDARNWTPHTVPNGPLDIATFNNSSITDISLSNTIEVSEIVFNPGASPFTITCPKQLTLSGTGITNNSGVTQNFVANTQYVPILFSNSATAGVGTNFTNTGGSIQFDGNSTPASATFTTTVFGGYTIFHDNATCDTATFYNQDGGTTIPANGANATFINNSGGTTYLGISDRAGSATLIANDGGTIYFDAFSQGDMARVELFGNSYMDFSNAYDIQLGSIEGDGGTIEIGDSEVTVGTNNLSTICGGFIQDQLSESFGGTLIKVGTGTLTLTSKSIYKNGTVVSSGALIVGNIKGSATGTGPVQVNAGTLGGKGIITGATTIGTGSGDGAFLAPATGSKTGATLKIKNTLTLNSDSTFIYTYRAKSNIATTDLVQARGVTINDGATLDFNGTINGRLTPGLVFTVISNTSANPISGTFNNLPDGSTVVLAGNTFQASYEGGDGNDLTLTVVP